MPSRSLSASFLISFLFVASIQAQSLDRLRYAEINPPQPTSDQNKIVVTEFFSYQCPHCYSLDPVLAAWVNNLPDDVLFERVAISNGYQQWAPIAQAFHALKAMGELEALHTAIFRGIHLDGQRLYDRSSIVEWVQGQGVDADEFSDMYDSFSVGTAVRSGDRRAMAHRVDSVPTLAIEGRYRVAIGDNGSVEHFEQQLAAVSELIDMIRVEKGLRLSRQQAAEPTTEGHRQQ